MWVFYLISLPLTLGMVLTTLKYFAGPDVPRYVLFTVGYTWFCSLSIIILVPADIWTTIVGHDKEGIAFFWSWSYWSTFALTWAVAPIIQGYEDAGDFTVQERLRSSMRENLVFYLSVASVGLLGLILLIVMHKNWGIGVVGLAMACSNTFGLVTGAFLLGFGLSEIPKSIWKNAEWGTRQKVLSHKVAKMAANLDKAHQDLSNAIVISQATSKQMSKRDPLRPCMDVIDDMLVQMFSEDPAFEQTGGTIGENDMDYDADEKSMASLRRQLRRAREEYYRYRSTYRTYVTEALQLDDTIKNYDRGSVSGWKFVSSFRSPRAGTIGEFLDRLGSYEQFIVPSCYFLPQESVIHRHINKWMWRCMLKKQLKRLLAVLLGCISAAILLAESTLLPSVDLSIFSILIKAVGRQEVLVQVAAFIPLMYMCICTYYSLFKIGMLTFYSLTPRQSSSVSLLMICSMVARYAPPISYNFLNLICLHGDTKTIFEKRMGSIDDAVPFFGRGFNRIYPLIMVVYTLLVASNFFGKVISLLGKWKRLTFQNDSEDASGFDSSGVMILRKERMLLEQRVDVGEHIIPLAKNLNDTNADAEGAVMPMRSARNGNGQHSGEVSIEMKSSVKADVEVPASMPFKDAAVRHNGSRETDEKYYDSVKEHQGKQSEVTSSISLPEAGKFRNEPHVSSLANNPSGLLNSWASMKSNFQNFRANLEAKRFLPLRQMPEVKDSHSDSSESLDDIFEKLKRRPERDMDEFSEDG